MERRKLDWRRYSAPVAIASMFLAALSVVLYFNIREYLTVRDEVRFDVSFHLMTFCASSIGSANGG